ncbi:crotonase/enoyl-CoA hydratase family protein [Pseudomonas sp. SDO528_S397]
MQSAFRTIIIFSACSLFTGVVLAQSEAPAKPAANEVKMVDIPTDSSHKISVERRGAIVLIGINRPYIQNRLDPEAYLALAKAYYDYDHDPSLRAAVLFGHGDNFSQGLDVEGFKAVASSGGVALGDGLIDPLGKKMPGLTKPLIVAVHGDTWNMAHELFLVADIRVAANNTNFGQDENTHGRFPGGGSTVRFVREAGWGNAMRYMLTGDHWTARDAYRMGTVQEIPDPQSALDKAVELANKIAANGPLGIKASLASAHRVIDPAQADALSQLDTQRAALYKSKDFQEGRKAEAEGRAPVYQGN